MYCPEKKRLNKFVKVMCPKPKDLFMRLGSRNPLGTGSNDGSDYSDVVDFNSSKLDNLQSVAMEERSRLYDEYRESMSKEAPQNVDIPVDKSE